MIFKPWAYQQFSINHILKHDACALFLDMGMGKTVSTLTAINDLLILSEIHKVLIIAPKRVAEDTWSTEVEKWDHLKELKISKIIGTAKQRVQAIEAEADIYIISRDNVNWLVNTNIHKWDMCVIDELSSFKSSKSLRFRSFRKLRPYFKKIVGLTGTPAPNSLIDLWPQMYLLDKGERLGKTITSFRQQYLTAGASSGQIVYKWNLKEGAEKAIQEKISDICISMKAEDYLELPDKLDNKIFVKLNDKVIKQYKQFANNLIIELGDKDITAANAAVLTNKLLQMANGAIYSENKEIVNLHNEKIEALEEIIDNSNEKPILIFYNFKHDRERIIEMLNKKGIKKYQGLDSTQDIKNWNEGKIQVALLHPASAGHGLNLQYGGNIIIWFGLTWSLELYQQANARLFRQGQKETVVINHLIAKNTVDEDVMKAIEGKEVNQNKLLEAVKARLKGETK